MPNVLTKAQIKQYKRKNYLSPFPALSADEARHYRSCLETYEKQQGGAPLEPGSTANFTSERHGQPNSCGYRACLTQLRI